MVKKIHRSVSCLCMLIKTVNLPMAAMVDICHWMSNGNNSKYTCLGIMELAWMHWSLVLPTSFIWATSLMEGTPTFRGLSPFSYSITCQSSLQISPKPIQCWRSLVWGIPQTSQDDKTITESFKVYLRK